MSSIGPYRILQRLGTCQVGQVWWGVDTDGGYASIAVLDPAVAGDERWRRSFAGGTYALAPPRGSTIQVARADFGATAPWVACAADSGPGAAQIFVSLGLPYTADPIEPESGDETQFIPPNLVAQPEPEPEPEPEERRPAGNPWAGAPAQVPAPEPEPEPEAEPAAAEPEPAVAEPEPAASQPEPEPAASQPEPEPAAYQPEPEPAAVGPAVQWPPPRTGAEEAFPPVSGSPVSAGQVSAGPVSGGPNPWVTSLVSAPPVSAAPPVAAPAPAPVWAPPPVAAPQPAPQPTPRRGTGRVVAVLAIVVLLLAGAGAATFFVLRNRDAAPVVASTAVAASPAAPSEVRAAPAQPGLEPPKPGDWPAAWPKFVDADQARVLNKLPGLGFTFRVPAGWECTEAGQLPGGARYACAGKGVSGEVAVRACPQPCDSDRRVEQRKLEEAWGLQWTAGGGFATYAESKKIGGADKYGLVLVSFWRTREEGAVDRQVTLRMSGTVDKADEVRKIANSVRDGVR